MFSCCLRTTRGSGLKKDKRQGRGGAWRHRIHSCLQRLWPFSRKGQNFTKGSEDQDHTVQGENASGPQNMLEPSREARFSPKTVDKLENNLVPSLPEGYLVFLSTFLSTCRDVTPLQVLDLLFMRYAFFCPYSEEDEQVKNTLCTFLETWMDKNPEDFSEPSDLFPLTYLKAFLSVYMPHSDLIVRVNRLLTQLQESQAKDSQAKDEEDSDLGRHRSSDPELQCCESVGKPAIMETEPTCAPVQESTEASRRFCDLCIAASTCGISTPAKTPDSSSGICVPAYL